MSVTIQYHQADEKAPEKVATGFDLWRSAIGVEKWPAVGKQHSGCIPTATD